MGDASRIEEVRGATQYITELPIEICHRASEVNHLCNMGDVVLYSEAEQTCIIHPGCIDHPGRDFLAYETVDCSS